MKLKSHLTCQPKSPTEMQYKGILIVQIELKKGIDSRILLSVTESLHEVEKMMQWREETMKATAC